MKYKAIFLLMVLLLSMTTIATAQEIEPTDCPQGYEVPEPRNLTFVMNECKTVRYFFLDEDAVESVNLEVETLGNAAMMVIEVTVLHTTGNTGGVELKGPGDVDFDIGSWRTERQRSFQIPSGIYIMNQNGDGQSVVKVEVFFFALAD